MAKQEQVPTASEKLAERFDTKEHGKNGKGMTYIGIAPIIERLNAVFGLGYSCRIVSVDLTSIPSHAVVHSRISYVDEEGNHQERDGIGADEYHGRNKKDVDDAVKTAFAESIKKAAHQLQVGLYLWDDIERKEVEAEMRAEARGERPASSTSKPAEDGAADDGLPKTSQELVAAITKEIERTNVSVAALKEWRKGQGMPEDSKKLTAQNLKDILKHLRAMATKQQAAQ